VHPTHTQLTQQPCTLHSYSCCHCGCRNSKQHSVTVTTANEATGEGDEVTGKGLKPPTKPPTKPSEKDI